MNGVVPSIGTHRCILHIKSVESMSASAAVFTEDTLKTKMSSKWTFGALDGYDVERMNLREIQELFSGEWALDKV